MFVILKIAEENNYVEMGKGLIERDNFDLYSREYF